MRLILAIQTQLGFRGSFESAVDSDRAVNGVQEVVDEFLDRHGARTRTLPNTSGESTFLFKVHTPIRVRIISTLEYRSFSHTITPIAGSVENRGKSVAGLLGLARELE